MQWEDLQSWEGHAICGFKENNIVALGRWQSYFMDFENDDEISYNILTFEHNRISMTSDFYFKNIQKAVIPNINLSFPSPLQLSQA